MHVKQVNINRVELWEMCMNIKMLSKLVGQTILIGVVLGLIFALIGWPAKMLWYRGMIVGGFVSVAVALMGFWAYLTLNFIMQTLMPPRVWMWFQALIVVVAVVDVVYFFPQLITNLPTGLSLPPGNYLWQILLPLGLAFVVALVKIRMTNRAAFIPAIFFMYVFTGVEWMPALFLAHVWRLAGLVWMILFVCNIFLILILGKLARKPSHA